MVRNNFCKSCIWWQHQFDSSDKKFGLCTNPIIRDYIKITPEENIDMDEAIIFTDALFGCNFHSGEPYAVAEIRPTI